MTNSVYFMNAGKFDAAAMLTFGVSAKDCKSPIGFFGTGFKYAVAIILRLGGEISIKTGGDTYHFGTIKQKIRDQEFDIVTCNGERAGFTTHMGANWEPWMAFRELWCNCKDEGGEISDQPSGAFDTVVTVHCDEIAQAYERRDLYFVNPNSQLVFENASWRVYEGHKHFLYYRGIAVASCHPTKFTWERKSYTTLSEDRVATNKSWDFDMQIAKFVQNSTDVAFIRKVLSAPEQSYERCLQFDPSDEISEEFVSVCRALMLTTGSISEHARNCFYKGSRPKDGSWLERELTRLQTAQLERAKAFLVKLDIAIEEFPLKVVDGLGDGVMGRAFEGGMYLSELPFQMGTKQVASTILEEWVHCKTSAKDFDRTMQTWLFDKILSIGEVMLGEPL